MEFFRKIQELEFDLHCVLRELEKLCLSESNVFSIKTREGAWACVGDLGASNFGTPLCE